MTIINLSSLSPRLKDQIIDFSAKAAGINASEIADAIVHYDEKGQAYTDMKKWMDAARNLVADIHEEKYPLNAHDPETTD